MMRNKFFGVAFILMLVFGYQQTAKSQTIELLAGNTLNGAVNGTLLGGATMALTNNTSFDPLRVGLGLGTLYGIGTGAYDISVSKGDELLVSGLFNDGTHTSVIVLLDTFYGAAAGAVIVTSVMLVANEPLLDGLQYGAGIGAWAGFGVGLFDAFIFAKRRTPSGVVSSYKNNSADGLVAINFNQGKSIGLVSPSFIHTYQTKGNALYSEIQPAVNLVNFKLSF